MLTATPPEGGGSFDWIDRVDSGQNGHCQQGQQRPPSIQSTRSVQSILSKTQRARRRRLAKTRGTVPGFLPKKPIFLLSERINLRQEHDPNPFAELDPRGSQKDDNFKKTTIFFHRDLGLRPLCFDLRRSLLVSAILAVLSYGPSPIDKISALG